MTWASQAIERIHASFEGARDDGRAGPMAAYMRDQFPFLGIPAPAQRTLLREAMVGMGRPDEEGLRELVGGLWELPEREYQYAGCGLVARHAKVCGPGFITPVEELITTRSWWDTVDSLAKGGAGALVRSYPALVATMDRWIDSENMWLRRATILHQLGFRERTDAERLFRYCKLRADESEFFIRKAIGWGLREYSKVDEQAVRGFVAERGSELSGLSRREALLWLNGGRAGRPRAK